MRLLLDTMYLLPAIGISVKGIPKDALIKLIGKGHQISISDVSIFELSAKGAKQVSAGAISPERVAKGIRAIVYDETIETVPTHEGTILLTAFSLRSVLSDFIDCLILSSAINRCDALITEDSDIQNLKKNKSFSDIFMRISPTFKVQTMAETL